MPSKSQKQHNLMEMAAHDPAKAKKLGFKIPVDVAQDFVSADKKSVKSKINSVKPLIERSNIALTAR